MAVAVPVFPAHLKPTPMRLGRQEDVPWRPTSLTSAGAGRERPGSAALPDILTQHLTVPSARMLLRFEGLAMASATAASQFAAFRSTISHLAP